MHQLPASDLRVRALLKDVSSLTPADVGWLVDGLIARGLIRITDPLRRRVYSGDDIETTSGARSVTLRLIPLGTRIALRAIDELGNARYSVHTSHNDATAAALADLRNGHARQVEARYLPPKATSLHDEGKPEHPLCLYWHDDARTAWKRIGSDLVSPDESY